MNVMQLLLKRYRRRVNKVIKGGSILSILFALMISLVIPPFNISAETITSHVIGTNVWTDRIDYVVVDSSANQFRNYCNVHVEIVFDNEYVGWQNLGLAVYYYSVNFSNNTWTRYSRQVSGNYYINGSSLEIVVPISFDSIAQPYYQAYNGTGQTLPQSDSSINLSFTTQGNVVAYSELQTLMDIYNILLDVQQNVSDSEDLLRDISNLRQYHYPLESFSFVSSLYNFGYDVVNNYQEQYWDYPVFNIPRTTESNLFYTTSGSVGQKFIFIFYSTLNISDNSLANRYVSFDNATLETTNQLGTFQFPDGTVYRLVKLTYVINSSYVAKYFKYLGNYYNDVYFIPVYANNTIFTNISLDFALNYGLNNDLLDGIVKIANGTTQSNTSSSNLETQKGTFDTTSNSLYNSENAFNTDMNSKLQSIDTSFNPSTSFGSKFLSSANWVRTQFDNITSTTPFGTVLSFSMLLGLSLLIIGKVFK